LKWLSDKKELAMYDRFIKKQVAVEELLKKL
jgi:hypothetical protein